METTRGAGAEQQDGVTGTIRTLTVAQTAERLHSLGLAISPQKVRQGLEQGVYPFGDCVTTDTGGRSFMVYAKLLEEWIAARM